MQFEYLVIEFVFVSILLEILSNLYKQFHLWPRGHSQTTFTAIGGGGVREMSTLLNKFGKFY